MGVYALVKRIAALVCAAVMLCLCLTSCGGDEPTVLFMPVDSVAGTLDPQIASDITALIIVRNCFEGLVRKTPEGNIVPGVAESWTVSDDGLEYTFRLRQDAQWHLTSNAQEELEGKLPENFDLSVTAYDFEFALNRALSPDTGAYAGFLLGNIENGSATLAGTAESGAPAVRAADRNTLVITLSSPQSNFLEILTEPVCMPCNETFFKACTGRYGRYIKYYLTNGPYYLSRLYEDSYRINKNPDYAGGFTPTNDAVWLYVNADRSSVIGKLEENGYTCALLSQYEYDRLDVSKKMSVISSANVLRCFVMNLDDGIMSNANIRKGLSAATDTVTAAENAGRQSADGIVPPCASDPAIATHPVFYDEENAPVYFARGLNELGLDSVSLEILCEECYSDMVKLLIQQWQKILGIGLSVTIRTCTGEELQSSVGSGKYQIAFASVASQSDSAWGYFSAFTENSPYNSTGYVNASIPGYLSRLYSGSDADYSAVYHNIEDTLLTASFIIPLWDENSYFVTNSAPEKISFLTGSDKIYFR